MGGYLVDKNFIINKLDALSENKVEKYCEADSIVKINSLRNKLETSDRIKIVNTGLVSSGKSTLFNILIDRIEDERFKTGAARETVKSDSECIEEGIYLIDTPGINVREEDDDLAYKSILESDIIVMILDYSQKSGQLNEKYTYRGQAPVRLPGFGAGSPKIFKSYCFKLLI